MNGFVPWLLLNLVTAHCGGPGVVSCEISASESEKMAFVFVTHVGAITERVSQDSVLAPDGERFDVFIHHLSRGKSDGTTF